VAITTTDQHEDFFEQALRWRERQYAALAELCLMAMSEPDIDRVLDTTAEQLRAALDSDFTKVLDQRAGETGLFLRAGAGWPDGVVGEREVPEGYQSQAGYTLEVDEPVLVADLLAETRFEPPALLLEYGIRSAVSVVMRGEGRIVGVLQADKRQTDHFRPDDIPIVQAYADVLGAAIAAAERAAIASSFASVAAHELRTPLTVIVGEASRMLTRHAASGFPQADRDALEAIESESKRLLDTIQLVLALSDVERRTAPVRPRSIDPVATLDAAIEAVSLAYPDQHLRLQADEDVDTVRADEAALSQVVTNLLVNAAKYSPAGSRITASVASGPEGPRIAIVDACGGMSTETLRHIYEWDFRGDGSSEQQQNGLGLGLYIARRLSERFGWDLSAENRDGGCAFTLELAGVPHVH
jgi:signal transduction histidine kinase